MSTYHASGRKIPPTYTTMEEGSAACSNPHTLLFAALAIQKTSCPSGLCRIFFYRCTSKL